MPWTYILKGKRREYEKERKTEYTIQFMLLQICMKSVK